MKIKFDGREDVRLLQYSKIRFEFQLRKSVQQFVKTCKEKRILNFDVIFQFNFYFI